MSENNFWVPISPGSEETEEKILEGISACHRVHSYTVETLNDYFIDHAENYRYHLYRRELGILIVRENLTSKAPRYSLIRAAEKSFPYFNERKKIKEEKFIPVKAIRPNHYREIQIESRKIWRKYIALNNLITTSFGTIYLLENWTEILYAQIDKLGISIGAVPFFMHSVTLRKNKSNWSMLFNLHNPDSKFGKIAKKEMKTVLPDGRT